jgi:hypothetical protein
MKMSVIVPYRDREQNLKLFVPHVKNFLRNRGFEWSVLVVEQEFGKPFNRAKLLNIGFDLTKDNFDYFCFHDVDLLPMNDTCDYSYPEKPSHLSTFVSQFNFIPRAGELGGVSIFNKTDYIKVNGHSNDYWGWGLEDNDMALRCFERGLEIEERGGRYLSLPHPPLGDTMNPGNVSGDTKRNRERFSSKVENKAALFDDGLSDLEFNIRDDVKVEDSVRKVVVGF